MLQPAGGKSSIPSPSQPSAGCSHCCVALHRTFHANVYPQGKLLPQSGEGHCGDFSYTRELGAYFPLSIYVNLHLPTLNFTAYFPVTSLRSARCFCNLLQAAPILQITQSQQQSYVRMKPKWETTVKPKQNEGETGLCSTQVLPEVIQFLARTTHTQNTFLNEQ